MEQKTTNPKIEDIIPLYLNSDMEKAALDFVMYMRSNKISPSFVSIDSWKASNKGKCICYIGLGEKHWDIIPHLYHLHKYKQIVINEGLQFIIWDNLFHCVKCNPRCSCDMKMTILGKKFVDICKGRAPIHCYSPNNATIHGIKRLLELEKEARADGSKSPFNHVSQYNDI